MEELKIPEIEYRYGVSAAKIRRDNRMGKFPNARYDDSPRRHLLIPVSDLEACGYVRVNFGEKLDYQRLKDEVEDLKSQLFFEKVKVETLKEFIAEYLKS